MKIRPRHGEAPEKIDRETFSARFRERFKDPAYRAEDAALQRIESIAWEAYRDSRKAPLKRRAGPGYADPEYELALDWLEARQAIHAADRQRLARTLPPRVLVVSGSARNDGSCPGELSKSWRMARLAEVELRLAGIEADLLDLSLLTSEYGQRIFPCKACVSTAMPLCHWPCSCYPNHSLDQVGDVMNAIYPRWVAADGVLLITPVYWYQSPSPLKLMIDRLVCADGGNPDPTSTHGKDAAQAKRIELDGWPYPKHLAGRAYGVVVHGDVAGIEGVRHALSDWLDWMGLVDAGAMARLDRYVGYYRPYATSHDELDTDTAVQEEVRNAARALAMAVRDLREDRLSRPDARLQTPRPK